MHIDASGLDISCLIDRLNTEYGLALVSLTFTPKGEEACAYRAVDAAGKTHFVRAQRANNNLDTCYAVTHALQHECGLRQVLAPYATRKGNFSIAFDGYTVAGFPFIDGPTVYERGVTAADITQAAQIMADLHG